MRMHTVRKRAVRRIGEQMATQAKTVGLAKGTRGQLIGRGVIGTVTDTAPIVTLAEAGIDKNFAKAVRAAAIPEAEFEAGEMMAVQYVTVGKATGTRGQLAGRDACAQGDLGRAGSSSFRQSSHPHQTMDVPAVGSRQLVEQRLGVFQVEGSRRQPSDGGMQPKPTIIALGPLAWHAEPGVRTPFAS
jgi:hypothetical protein